MTLLGLVILTVCTPIALLDFAIPKWDADPSVRIQDAYKWLYQATRGGEHAAPDRESAKKWLNNEWLSLGPAKNDEPTWEPLCPGDEMGRLNLRPFRDAGGKADDLLDAFLASAREYKTEPSAFMDAWARLGERLKKKKIGALDRRSWKKLNAEMKTQNYPAVHHSKHYQQVEKPAYRIITKAELIKLRALHPAN